MRGKGEVAVEIRAEWGLRCHTGAWISAGWGQKMFGTRYYYFGLRGRLRQAAECRAVDGPHALKWRNGFAVGATFAGEFSNVTRSHAGRGIVRYVC
jgi:hypothetical protein